MGSTRTPAPSLRSRLLRHVLLPLALTWLAGTWVSVQVASGLTERAFDRSLIDDAYAVAANLRHSPAGVNLTLTPREVASVLFDQIETVQYAVLHPDGTLLAGDWQEPVPSPGEDDIYRFSDLQHQGKKLRAVRLRLDNPEGFEVVVVATTRSRQTMLRSVLMYSGISQLLLLLALAAWLRMSISRDLQPLTDFQQALDNRHARDLAPVHVATSTRDMQHMSAAVNDLLARVAHGVRAQREFAGNIAHELRTPLAGIRAQASYGLTQKDPQAWREQLAGIVQSEARASHLVDQLLALALADEGMQEQWVQLDELVQETVLRFLPRADAAGVDLGARGLETPVAIRSHPLLLEGILNNLIDNALRYGAVAGQTAKPHITVELAHDGTSVALTVMDNGPGIEASQQARLMQRGTQGLDGDRLGQGAGLGLSIVRRYAQLLDAQLSMTTGPQQRGLAVTLWLPGAAQAQPPKAGATTH
ncbi:MAG TPA: sensor histidine kinase [Acidovorax sp.]|nr:sensor histidine kinase [Acidovorax sp.]